MTWRWDPNVHQWLSKRPTVRLVPPLVELYDWQDDPDLAVRFRTLAELGYPDGLTPDDGGDDLDWDEARDVQWEAEDVAWSGS